MQKRRDRKRNYNYKNKIGKRKKKQGGKKELIK